MSVSNGTLNHENGTTNGYTNAKKADPMEPWVLYFWFK